MSDPKTILCIEDNTDSCDLISFIFKRAGFEVIACRVPEEGIRLARTNHFAAIILDLWFDGLDGLDVCRIIRTFNTETPIIFYTGEARPEKEKAALEAGAQAYLIKPEGFERLERTVVGLINKSIPEPRQEAPQRANLSFGVCKTYHPRRNN
jgi:DNA-binding response OmpR family regulator